MTLPVEINPLLLGSGGASGYDLSRSVRLRGTANASVSRVVGTPTSQNVWTYNAWVKLGNLTADAYLINTGGGGSNFERLRFIASTGTLNYTASTGGGAHSLVKATAGSLFFRDTSSWYNIHVIKTASANSGVNCVRVWINNIEVIFTNTYTGTQASVPDSINVLGSTLTLGTANSVAFDGYFANINFVDGLALPPQNFAVPNTGNGMPIKPKIYTGAFGNNGFWLAFTDASASTPTTLGKDSSGNGNNFTINNITTAVPTASTYDSMFDVPTLTNSTIANFPTLNQTTLGTSCLLTEGNLTATWTTITAATGINTQSNFPIPRTGKYYFEVLLNTSSNGCADFGIWPINNLPTKGAVGTLATGYSLRPGGAGTGTMRKFNNATLTAWGAAPAGFGTSVVYGVAVDMTAGAIYFRDAVGWMNSSNSNDAQPTSAAFTGISGDYVPAVGHIAATGQSSSMTVNFGQRPFTHTVPTGYLRLNTYNWPDSAVPRSNVNFNTFYYNGNGYGLQVGETQRPLALYPLNASLRFKASTTATLTKTPAAASNRTTWTRSLWVKREKMAIEQYVYGIFSSGTALEYLTFNITTNALDWTILSGGSTGKKTVTQLFTDTNTWINIVQIYDSTNAVGEDRMQLWVNGIRMTVFNTNTIIAQNNNSMTNSTTAEVYGAYNAGNYFDGYMSDIYLVDGLVVSPTSFGQFDANGYWVPKQYTGSYGTNGYHLTFEDRTGQTATTIGKDTSGNGNNFTPAGISVTVPASTAGVNYDAMNDVPTNTSLTVADFPVLDGPLPSNYSVSGANLNVSGSLTASSFVTSVTNIPVAGKYYWEYTCTNTGGANLKDTVGMTVKNAAQERLGTTTSTIGYSSAGTINQAGSFSTWTNGDVIGIAVDGDAGKVWFAKNNTWQGSGDPSAGTNPNSLIYPTLDQPWFPAVGIDAASGSPSVAGSINFGQRPFLYTPPTGFKMINSFNADEVIGDLEKPDFVWIKARTGSGQTHALFTSVVGVGKYISTFGTVIEATDLNSLIQFNKNGFLLGNSVVVNAVSQTYMGAAWKVTGGTTSWNFDGTLGRTATMTTADPCVVSVSTNAFVAGQAVQFTTTGALPSPVTTGVTYYAGNIVTNTTFNLYDTEANAIIGGATGRISTAGSSQSGVHTCKHAAKIAANPTAGMSIITYCGSSVNGATLGHGLGALPSFFIAKCRSTTAMNTCVYHATGLTSPAYNNVILTNSTARDAASTWLANNPPTSSVISLGLPGDANDINVSGRTYEIIAFTEIPGFSKFTTYLSNNTAANGPYVNCGFRPRWVMIKSRTSSGGWMIFDGARLLQNTNSRYLFAEANSNDASLGGGVGLDFTASGFKILTNTLQVNGTTDLVYMIMAFAENPFKYALAR